MNRVLPFLLLLLFAAPTRACMWDSDTLEAEAKGIPDTIRVITGRFERNPDLYYEMRLARVTKELQSTPGALELYDDAGVACDRLRRGDEAIAWMEKKRAQMAKLKSTAKPGVLRTHRYRYLANLGTFIAHRWLRNGADRNKISEMKRARDLIRAAIQLNPNAHFGREKYQLKAMEWILHPPKLQEEYLPSIMGPKFDNGDEYGNVPTAKEAVAGLSGLIVLGDAWQSVDIFHALRNSVQLYEDRSVIAYLAQLRIEELVNAGNQSLLPRAPKGKNLLQLIENIGHGEYQLHDAKAIKAHFKTLRAEADEWHAQRTAYMIGRMEAGRHPDTDKTFWNEWEEPSAPSLYMFSSQKERARRQRYFNIGLAAAGVLCVSLLMLKFARRKKAGG